MGIRRVGAKSFIWEDLDVKEARDGKQLKTSRISSKRNAIKTGIREAGIRKLGVRWVRKVKEKILLVLFQIF